MLYRLIFNCQIHIPVHPQGCFMALKVVAYNIWRTSGRAKRSNTTHKYTSMANEAIRNAFDANASTNHSCMYVSINLYLSLYAYIFIIQQIRIKINLHNICTSITFTDLWKSIYLHLCLFSVIIMFTYPKMIYIHEFQKELFAIAIWNTFA